MTTFGERVDEMVRETGAAEHLDTAFKRLASALDPTDTDEGAEKVFDELRYRFRGVVADAAVRNGWRLP